VLWTGGIQLAARSRYLRDLIILPILNIYPPLLGTKMALLLGARST